jgi:hypothetical protein
MQQCPVCTRELTESAAADGSVAGKVLLLKLKFKKAWMPPGTPLTRVDCVRGHSDYLKEGNNLGTIIFGGGGDRCDRWWWTVVAGRALVRVQDVAAVLVVDSTQGRAAAYPFVAVVGCIVVPAFKTQIGDPCTNERCRAAQMGRGRGGNARGQGAAGRGRAGAVRGGGGAGGGGGGGGSGGHGGSGGGVSGGGGGDDYGTSNSAGAASSVRLRAPLAMAPPSSYSVCKAPRLRFRSRVVAHGWRLVEGWL